MEKVEIARENALVFFHKSICQPDRQMIEAATEGFVQHMMMTSTVETIFRSGIILGKTGIKYYILIIIPARSAWVMPLTMKERFLAGANSQ